MVSDRLIQPIRSQFTPHPFSGGRERMHWERMG